MDKITEAVSGTLQHAGQKLTSGRLIATVVINGVGAYMLAKQIPMPGEFIAMWGVVTTFYFTKRD